MSKRGFVIEFDKQGFLCCFALKLGFLSWFVLKLGTK